MKLTKYSLLTESLKTARERYVDTGLLPKTYLSQIAEADPTKTKKYTEWMCNQIVNHRAKLSSLKTKIKEFEEAIKTKYELPSKDINYYKTTEELDNALSEFSNYTINQRSTKKKGAELIYEDDLCYLYYIKTKEACMLYGSNTKWCITEKGTSHWENYNNTNFFLFLIRKQPPHLKYALVIPKESYMHNTLTDNHDYSAYDEYDTEVNFVSSLKSNSNLNFTTLIQLLKTKLSPSKLKKDGYNLALTSKHLVKNNDGTYNIISVPDLSYAYHLSPYLLDDKGELLITFDKCNANLACLYTNITSLKGFPKEINGFMDISHNYKLRSLEGGPTKVSDYVRLSFITALKNLDYLPKVIGTYLDLTGCISLKNLNALGNTSFINHKPIYVSRDVYYYKMNLEEEEQKHPDLQFITVGK